MSVTTQPVLAEYRAGGTDLSERRRTGISHGPVRDVPRVVGSELVRRTDGGLTLGADPVAAAMLQLGPQGVVLAGSVQRGRHPIEQPEPGGVSWTNRRASLTTWS